MAVHIQFLRYVHAFRWNRRRVGRILFPAMLVLLGALFAWRIPHEMAEGRKNFAAHRERFRQALERLPGKHLVFVHYSDWHPVHDDWVYNEPDILSSRVVWARELSAPADRNLVAFCQDRDIWVVQADAVPPRLTPWPLERRDR